MTAARKFFKEGEGSTSKEGEGTGNKRVTQGTVELIIDEKQVTIPWHQPGQMVHFVFADEKAAKSFRDAVINELADDPDPKVSNIKQVKNVDNLLIREYRAKNLEGFSPDKPGVAVRLSYTQLCALQAVQNNKIKLSTTIKPQQAAPGGPAMKS